MSKVDYELLDRLTAWMQEEGFTRLTYTRGKSTVTLHLPEERPRGRARRPDDSARSSGISSPGIHWKGEALRRERNVGRSWRHHRTAGDRARFDAGRSAVPGCRAQSPCTEGAIVGFDDPLFEIEPKGI